MRKKVKRLNQCLKKIFAIYINKFYSFANIWPTEGNQYEIRKHTNSLYQFSSLSQMHSKL